MSQDKTILAGRSRRFQEFINSMEPSDPRRQQIEASERTYVKESAERHWFEENIYREQMVGAVEMAVSDAA